MADQIARIRDTVAIALFAIAFPVLTYAGGSSQFNWLHPPNTVASSNVSVNFSVPNPMAIVITALGQGGIAVNEMKAVVYQTQHAGGLIPNIGTFVYTPADLAGAAGIGGDKFEVEIKKF